MKKYLAFIISISIAFFLYACGGGGGGPHLGGASSNVGYQLSYDRLVTDTSSAPFPNTAISVSDVLLSQLTSSSTSTAAGTITRSDTSTQSQQIYQKLALYAGLIALKLDGFSPNTPISIPLNGNPSSKNFLLNQSELQNNIDAIDINQVLGITIGTLSQYYYDTYADNVTTDPCYKLDNLSKANDNFTEVAQYCEENQDNQTVAQLCAFCAAKTLNFLYNDNKTLIANTFANPILSEKIFAPIIVKQNGYTINAYPVIPFNPGHTYLVVIKNGIDNLTKPAAFSTIFKEISAGLNEKFDNQTPYLLNALLTVDNTSKDGILEIFTFNTASRTLSLQDYDYIRSIYNDLKNGDLSEYSLISTLKDYVGNNCNPTTNTLCAVLDNISQNAYYYKDLDNMTYNNDNVTANPNEYLQIDALSDIPLMCQDLYDNETLRSSYKLPMITSIIDNATTLLANLGSIDNVTSFMLTPNLYNLIYIQPIAQDLIYNYIQYKLTDNSTYADNASEDCLKIFDNATLYDNVTAAIYAPSVNNASEITGYLIYQHGLTRDKNDAGILRSEIYHDNGTNTYLTFAMDLPWHGGRIPPNPILASVCSSTSSGSCYLTSNPINDVMNLYQSLLDMHTFTKFVYKSDKNNYSSPLPIYFVGQSMGSITGSMLLNIDNITYSQALALDNLLPNNIINKAVLNVGGSNYTAILNEATSPLIMGKLLCNTLDIPSSQCTPEALSKYRSLIKYNLTLALFQLILDPVDPAFMARNIDIKNKILLQNAKGDNTVPNVSNELLYYDYNYDYNNLPSHPFTRVSPTLVSCDNVTATGTTTTPEWYMFKGYSINHDFLINNTCIGAIQQICTFLSPPAP